MQGTPINHQLEFAEPKSTTPDNARTVRQSLEFLDNASMSLRAETTSLCRSREDSTRALQDIAFWRTAVAEGSF